MAELDLTLWDDFLPHHLTLDIMKIAKHDLNVPPSYPITLKHYEALWGNSEVAQLNNNWGGVTWSPNWNDPHTRKSGVIVSRGTARPVIEGGHYVKYDSVADFFRDWAYLMGDEAGFYNVQNASTFQLCIYGMFMVGGALGDYATMNVEGSQLRYELYYAQILARRNAINEANNDLLDRIDNGEFDHLIDNEPEPDPSELNKKINEIITLLENGIDGLENVDVQNGVVYDYGNSGMKANGNIIIQKMYDNVWNVSIKGVDMSDLINQLETIISELEKMKENEPTPTNEPVLPVDPPVTLTDRFGMRFNPITDEYELHNGLDFAGDLNANIYSVKSGEVVTVWFNEFRGNWMMVKHDGEEIYSKYLHLNHVDVTQGQTVSKGQKLGGMGTTGQSTGVHLHLTISTTPEGGNDGGEWVDPEIYLVDVLS